MMERSPPLNCCSQLPQRLHPSLLFHAISLQPLSAWALLQATWHCGSMLPQTVFTSLYMLQPERWVAAGLVSGVTACRMPHAACMVLVLLC